MIIMWVKQKKWYVRATALLTLVERTQSDVRYCLEDGY